MTATIVETDAKTVTLRLLSPETLPILQHLERVHLLEILPTSNRPARSEERPARPTLPAPVAQPARQWAGSISPETGERMQREMEEMRNEWEGSF